jgi:hypothetical protein
MKAQDRFEILLEDLHGKMDIVLEALGVVRNDVAGLKTDMVVVRNDVRELKLDMRVVKQVLKDHETEIKQLRRA